MTPKELEPCSPLSQCFGKTPKCKRECEEDSCRIVPVPKCQDVEDTVSHFFYHLPNKNCQNERNYEHFFSA